MSKKEDRIKESMRKAGERGLSFDEWLKESVYENLGDRK